MNVNNYSKEGIQFIEVENNKGLKVVFANLGASIFKINLDKYVLIRNVYDIKDFYNENIYHGKTVGRTSNRLKGHKFKLHDVIYEIEPNEGNNVLHGGKHGVSYAFFEQNVITETDKVNIIYSRVIKEEEDGYPGNLELVVRYIVYLNSNEIDIEFKARCDKDSVISLTNHSYFTLGCRSLKGLTLQINGGNYLKTDKDLLPLGKEEVTSVLDFRNPKKITQDIASSELIALRLNGYDHFYYLDNKDINIKALSLTNAKIQMDVYTDYEGIQIYTSGYPTGVKMYPEVQGLHDCVAIEPSDSFEKLHFLKKDTMYSRTIKYIFNYKE